MISFRLIPDAEIDSIMPLLLLLDTRFSEDVLKGRLEEMLDNGYQCVGIYDDEKLIGASGLWILCKYYVGKHIEPDNAQAVFTSIKPPIYFKHRTGYGDITLLREQRVNRLVKATP